MFDPDGDAGGTFELTGGATADLTGLHSHPDWAGMLLFWDRENEAEFKLTGSSETSLKGTMYIRDGLISMTGPSGQSTLGSTIVANAVKMTGQAVINLDFSGGQQHALLTQIDVGLIG